MIELWAIQIAHLSPAQSALLIALVIATIILVWFMKGLKPDV